MGADLPSSSATRRPGASRHARILALATALAALLAVAQDPGPGSPARPLASDRLPHCFQISPRLWSGAQPAGDDAFAELHRLGIRVVLSVDGTRPDLEAAHRQGLRYLHLPFGYDGIPSNRVVELVRVATGETNGGIYVHCHHGLHRGPTAAAIVAMASGTWTPDDARAFLRQAGTSSDYPGLHRAVRNFTLPSAAELDRIGPLPEVNVTTSEVAVMVELDAHLDRIRTALERKTTAPSEEAVLLWEQLREWSRQPAPGAKPAGYRTRLGEAEAAAHHLKEVVASSDAEVREAALRDLGRTCTACHREYRNP
ncbi:MAG: cytochrome c [Verrucomicrobiota bacterium]